jgi:hypothetical protein
VLGFISLASITPYPLRESPIMNLRTVAIKPETRNHKGFFVQETDYTFVELDKSGWALICVDDAVCHYVDPDNILAAELDVPKAI